MFWKLSEWIGAAVLVVSALTAASYFGAWLADRIFGPIKRKPYEPEPLIDHPHRSHRS